MEIQFHKHLNAIEKETKENVTFESCGIYCLVGIHVAEQLSSYTQTHTHVLRPHHTFA